MKRHLICIALIASAPSIASAAKSWVCQAAADGMYISSHRVPEHECREVSDSERLQEFPDLVGPSRVGVSSKVKLFCNSQPGASCESHDGSGERGIIKNSKFHIYASSASVAAKRGGEASDHLTDATWSIDCSRDKMTTRRTCHVNKGDLWIFFMQGGREYISIGNEHFPGSVTSIRIGPKRFDTLDRDGDFSQSKQIIAAMKDGSTVVTRYMKWPYRQWVDEEFESHGAQAAVQVARWLLKHSNPQ